MIHSQPAARHLATTTIPASSTSPGSYVQHTMQHMHIPRMPAAMNHNSASPRRPNVTAPNNPSAVHASKSNKAWLTYPDTPARVVPQQNANQPSSSARIVPQQNTGSNHSNRSHHLPGSPQPSNIAQTSGGGCYLGPSNSGQERMGSSLGPTGGWGFGGGVQGQLGGMSAEARAEKVKRESFRDAISLIGTMDAGKASELKGRWERECGALGPEH